jgi:glucose/arabinose dehydrogenase
MEVRRAKAGGAALFFSGPGVKDPDRMRTRLGGATVALLLLVLAFHAGPAAAQAVYPTSFEERNVITGLWMPVAAEWTPDGRTLIAEKPGRVKIAAPGASTATTILDIGNRVNNHSDRGLLDIAVDSSFASNHFIYVLYTYDVNQLTPDSQAPMVSRLERYVLNDDNTLSGPTVLLGSYVSGPCPAASNTLDCIPSDGLSHSIGTVASAPDGTLWVGSGDAASWSIVDPLAFRTYDEQSMVGKIMRIDRNGNGVAGHPFCSSNANLTHVCTKVWAKGFRNPYRFKLRAGGGLTVGDVGWNDREELELIDPNEMGRSWGWPCYEGTFRTPGYRDRAECPAEYAKEGTANAHAGPDYDYQHSSSGNAVLGGPQYTGDQYPSGYRGQVFFGDYAGGFIRRATLDSQNRVTSVSGFATGWSGTDIVEMPDGNVGYVAFGTGAPGTGSLKSIVYSPGNATPIASAAGTPTSGNAPLTVAFSSSGSRDPDGDALSYSWDFGDGTSSTAANPSKTYNQTGSYTARLTLNDGRGRTASATVAINVGNGAPTVSLDAPADGSPYTNGETVNLRASGSDAQDGTLPSSAFTWNVSLIHGSHTHPYTQLTGSATSFHTQQDHDADSYYEITVTARDSGGLTASRKIRINPRTVRLTLASSPAGAPISYSGFTAQDAPFDRTAATGYRTSVSAADSFTAADGKRYVFDSWSDGGSRLHDITVPSSDGTLTANYKTAPAGPVPGLVGAWGFDDGSGSAARDASGSGNDGVVSGAAWSAGGRFGGALDFDGVDDWVTVADDDSLDMTGPLTLEAWVRPDTLGTWDTVVMKEAAGYFSYALYGTTAWAAPSGWARDAVAEAKQPLAANGWTHLAVTYDGTNTRLYVNGALVTSTASPFSLPNSDRPLRIGGNGIWSGEFFDGLIDEVRVYNRTLTGAEVVSDMNAAVGGGSEPPPPPQDTTPPSARITAPVAGSTVSGSVDVTADAADNVGVASVQFKVGTTNIGSADTTAPYSVPWNTTTVANGNHSLTAVARDAAGNTVTSSPVQVTVSNGTTQPSGLVGAWSFDEGGGTAAADRSGRNNDGTVSGAAWSTSGRFGGALNFDGVNDWVTVADSPSLDMAGPLTLEAWVKPDVLGNWDTVVMKEASSYLAYALYATGDWQVPSGWARDSNAQGTQFLSTTAWSHLAYTFDGTVSKLYVNGVLVSSATMPFALPDTSQPLRIGGNGIWSNEFFDGLIDEVRVYSRSLSAAEVGADMGRGIGSAASAAKAVPTGLRSMAVTGAPDVSLAEVPASVGRIKARRLRRTKRPRGATLHQGTTSGRSAGTRRCPTGRKARRGSSRRGSARGSSRSKACKKPRKRRGRR